MQHKVLYTSDIHGNEVQYQKLIEYAKSISADTIIIGGDIAPKSFPMDVFIKGQREFLKNRLPELLSPSNSKIFLIMGNDDAAVNLDVLERNDLYQVIHGKRIKLTEEFDIVGYSYVPITPFYIKDWEKFDLSRVPPSLQAEYAYRKKTNYKLGGFKSTKSGLEGFRFNPKMALSDSLQKDLEDELFQKNADKTVYVIHTPPNKTNLDQLLNRSPAGSMAIRIFIEDFQPYLTLHGHIHETVAVSRDFKHRIGDSLCLSSGNHDIGDELAVLVFDLYNIQDVERIIL